MVYFVVLATSFLSGFDFSVNIMPLDVVINTLRKSRVLNIFIEREHLVPLFGFKSVHGLW